MRDAGRPHTLRRLGLGPLFAGACLGIAQAASGGTADLETARPESTGAARIASGAPTPQAPPAPAELAEKKSSPPKRGKKAAATSQRRVTPSAPSAAKTAELMHLSGAEIEKRIAAQRQTLRRNPGDEAARQTLGLITVELANRILDFDALDRRQDIAYWMAVIRKDLNDTLWRVTQLARVDGRSAAALGLLYSEGLLTARAPEKGCEQYVRAAQRGQTAAAYQAGLCKAHTDAALAKTLLENAARKGHAGAQELMGRACIEGEVQNRVCAIKWLERAASQGRPSSMSLLGWMYASDPEHADFVKAVAYYRPAAEAGDQAAQNNLGELYETGRGVSPDAAQAFNWYARAAKAGFAPAQLNLARLYASGAGTARDLPRARLWAERARKQGQERAGELLDWLAAQASN